jgi:murein DD-endopeptidase MepM/ murein hydrolase activator NlpD
MAESFIQLLESIKTHSVMNPEIPMKEYVLLDLSIQNHELTEVNISAAIDLETYISKHMISNNAKVAYGGYLEHRDIYKRSDYFNQSIPETERNIHLGLDFWTLVAAPIYAPLKGEIHSFKNNTNYGDYGPTIILKHDINDIQFYTLYGHLSLNSLADKHIGDKIRSGQKIATLGTSKVNGDYPPHLHFQIIKDIQDYEGDYPGVVNKLELEFYKSNCPDPNLLLKLQEC